jgi:hypothetical protein
VGKSDSWVEYQNVDVLKDTPKALLCLIEGKEYWIPRSQISDDSEVYSLDSSGGTLIITEWIAKGKGLI